MASPEPGLENSGAYGVLVGLTGDWLDRHLFAGFLADHGSGSSTTSPS